MLTVKSLSATMPCCFSEITSQFSPFRSFHVAPSVIFPSIWAVGGTFSARNGSISKVSLKFGLVGVASEFAVESTAFVPSGLESIGREQPIRPASAIIHAPNTKGKVCDFNLFSRSCGTAPLLKIVDDIQLTFRKRVDISLRLRKRSQCRCQFVNWA